MNEPINILIVDDNARDAELAEIELKRKHVPAAFRIAVDEAELRQALVTFDADVILCDFAFPQFDGIQAIAIMREYHPHTPVIFVSGTIDENRAVIALQSGAVDYVLKSNLTRLPVAVTRAVEDARERKRLRGTIAVAELRSERQVERLEALWRIANDSSLHGEALLTAMLAEAAAALRSPLQFGGILSRVDGSDIVVVITTKEDEDGRGRVPGVGMRMPISTTLAGQTLRTASWDDLSGENAPAVARKFGWQSVITTTFGVGADRYYLTFVSLERVRMPFGQGAVAYVELVAAAFANSIHLDALTTSLRESEARSRFQAERLERLWVVANDSALAGRERWTAMLRTAATSIRKDVPFRAWFARVEGTEIIQEAMIESDDVIVPEAMRAIDVPIPIAGTIAEKFLELGLGIHAVDDFAGSAFETERSRTLGWRALLMISFAVGSVTYLLAFVHSEPTTEPFGPFDTGYIRMLAAFFERNVAER